MPRGRDSMLIVLSPAPQLTYRPPIAVWILIVSFPAPAMIRTEVTRSLLWEVSVPLTLAKRAPVDPTLIVIVWLPGGPGTVTVAMLGADRKVRSRSEGRIKE